MSRNQYEDQYRMEQFAIFVQYVFSFRIHSLLAIFQHPLNLAYMYRGNRDNSELFVKNLFWRHIHMKEEFQSLTLDKKIELNQ